MAHSAVKISLLRVKTHAGYHEKRKTLSGHEDSLRISDSQGTTDQTRCTGKEWSQRDANPNGELSL